MEPRPLDRRRSLRLTGMTDVVTRCRDFTRAALIDWKWMPGARDDAEDVLLLVSEVVANACLHAGGPHALLLECTDDRLRVEVTDGNPAAPTPRSRPDPARPGGYGLLIVERIARRWGTMPLADGKCVWAEIDSPLRSPDVRGPQPVS
ncbi:MULTISPECIES: ATP-binding protein [unclassified Streptomyces]|uniref:ATP-binding protein n=1 Tax=unclassified Streptomyces TaxID=2593676 RepID=UPI0006AF0E50|nr:MULTISPECIES: ATP-binding protein [unclassified Streptomyces]KOV49326.1 regulator [Streptomyces sp. MMG1064]